MLEVMMPVTHVLNVNPKGVLQFWVLSVPLMADIVAWAAGALRVQGWHSK
jgi:hypothetical protein